MIGFSSVNTVYATPFTFGAYGAPQQVANDTTTTTTALGQSNTSSGVEQGGGPTIASLLFQPDGTGLLRLLIAME